MDLLSSLLPDSPDCDLLGNPADLGGFDVDGTFGLQDSAPAASSAAAADEFDPADLWQDAFDTPGTLCAEADAVSHVGQSSGAFDVPEFPPGIDGIGEGLGNATAAVDSLVDADPPNDADSLAFADNLISGSEFQDTGFFPFQDVVHLDSQHVGSGQGIVQDSSCASPLQENKLPGNECTASASETKESPSLQLLRSVPPSAKPALDLVSGGSGASSEARAPARGKPRDKTTQRKLRNKESARRYREKQVAKRRQLENFTRSLADQNQQLELLHDKLLSLTCGQPDARPGPVINTAPLQDMNK